MRGERRFQAIVRLPETYRSNIDDIKQIMVLSPSGPRVPLEDLASIRVLEGPAQINRDMAKRRIVVGINVQGRDLGGYVAELQKTIYEKVPLPAGYYIQWGGSSKTCSAPCAIFRSSFRSPLEPSSSFS